MRIPEGLARELRGTMCTATYMRVLEILGRWVETASAPMVISGLEQLANRPEQLADITAAREEVSLATLGNMIIARERDFVERLESLSYSQDARVTNLCISVLRTRPRR